MTTKPHKIGIATLLITVLLCCSAIAAEEPRTLFNHGAELAASGKLDEATEVLRQVAVVRNETIAAKALSLLGQIAASSAREHLADNPEETSPEDRQKIVEHLQSAERSFAESLLVQPNDEVRQYLETLRAWRHNMTNVWEEYDREQRRYAELQERIRTLADWEEKLTGKVRPLLEEPNSPRKFQTEFEAGREQKKLAEELARLQEQDIPITDEELAKKWARLPEIQKLANEAAELLSNHRTEEALPKQEQVLEYLRTLLPQEDNPQENNSQNQQDQEQDKNQEQNQDQNDQDQQRQDQQSQQDQNGQEEQEEDQQSQEEQQEQQSQQNGEQESEPNEPRTSESKQHTESPEDRAERLLMQVRRKEQAARELRDQLRALLLQDEPVKKGW